jgi:hypothetical protein
MYQKSLMHCHEDKQYADRKKAEGYAKLIKIQIYLSQVNQQFQSGISKKTYSH